MRLGVHPHTLSRFLWRNPDLMALYRENYESRLALHITDMEYDGAHHQHPLRAIFLCEKFHLLDESKKRRKRAFWRDSIKKFPAQLKPIVLR